MTFKDIFKKSFLEGFSRYDMSPTNILIVMAIATGFAIYIFMAYRLLTRKTFYSKSFNISLAAVTVITTAIILTIQSSVVISLGMVGALSIGLFVLDRIPVGRAPQILMVSADGYDIENDVLEIVKKCCAYYTVKSRSLSNNRTDLVVEVRTLKAFESKLVQEVAALKGITSSSLLRHDGEVTY